MLILSYNRPFLTMTLIEKFVDIYNSFLTNPLQIWGILINSKIQQILFNTFINIMVSAIWSGKIREKLVEDIEKDIFYYIFHEIVDLASVCWNLLLPKNLIFGLKTGFFAQFWAFPGPIWLWKYQKLVQSPKNYRIRAWGYF